MESLGFSSRRLGLTVAFTLASALVAGCTTPPDGEYCACAEHGKPTRCVELKQDGDDVKLDLRIDGESVDTMSAKYVAEGGYGRADTDMGELEVSLGRTLFGVGAHPTSAHFKGDRAGPYNFSMLLRDNDCG